MLYTATHNAFSDFNRLNSGRYGLFIDWVSLHVRHGADFSEKNTLHYKIERSGQTKVFRNVYSITDIWGKLIATYATDPASCIMPPFHGVLKLSNRELYTNGNLFAFTERMLDELGFVFIGITRLDIAYDFNSFQNRKDPERFIADFASGRILKVKNAFVRASWEHSADDVPTAEILKYFDEFVKLKGLENHSSLGKVKKELVRSSFQHNHRNTFEWIHFGSKNSTVCFKLYNKTREQEKEGRKPYIWEAWERSTLIDANENVWRLEFTLNSNTFYFANRSMFTKFHNLENLLVENYAPIFLALYENFFRFVHSTTATTKKCRMKPVLLNEFDPSLTSFGIARNINAELKDSSRATKILINKLNQHAQEMREISEDVKDQFVQVNSKLINMHDLSKWATDKNIEFERNEFSGDVQSFKEAIGSDIEPDDSG